jgi:hypothetical protein
MFALALNYEHAVSWLLVALVLHYEIRADPVPAVPLNGELVVAD